MATQVFVPTPACFVLACFFLWAASGVQRRRDNRMIELLMLEKTLEILESNHNLAILS